MSNHKNPFELNLLLKQQNTKKFGSSEMEIKYEQLYIKTVNNAEVSSDMLLNEKNTMSLTLTRKQMEESSSFSQCKQLWDQYEVLKTNLERLSCYLTCLQATTRATKDVMEMITDCTADEPDDLDLHRMETLILSLLADGLAPALWAELERSRKDYGIATKNFKILLEIIDFGRDELNKLKSQYEDVYRQYRIARAQLEKELPTVVDRMKVAFFNCVQALGDHIEDFVAGTTHLRVMVKDLLGRCGQGNSGAVEQRH